MRAKKKGATEFGVRPREDVMLRFEAVELRSASLLCEDLIPDIRGVGGTTPIRIAESVPRDSGMFIGEGEVCSALPYTMQAFYDRELKTKTYRAAVLENEFLKAIFLPELGGRLWSLYDKKRGRELVYRNRAVIFANLALRNAWFAGGVEWNVGVRGHTYSTCSPLFACKEVNREGEEILKMYEYEPIRGLAFVIRAGLCKGDLRVQITVENTKNEPTYLYWWSNIAVEQTERTRVFVPTEQSYVTTYREGELLLSRDHIFSLEGEDITYPARAEAAKDYFFDIPKERKKWIAAVEGDGVGLLQCSSDTLQGRKLFVWGNTVGGKHWNSWLTDGGSYAEIQAGLAKTQFEHIPMAARAIVSWNECYRAIEVEDVDADFGSVSEKIDRQADRCDFDRFFEIKDCSEPLIRGSGRGALASLLDPTEAPTICEFSTEELTDSEAYFLSLIHKKTAPKNPKIAYSNDLRYLEMIEKNMAKSNYDRYVCGVISAANGQIERAEKYFLEVAGEYRWLALACLARIEFCVRSDPKKAFDYVQMAFAENREDAALLNLYGEIAIKAGQYRAFLEVSEGTQNGRTRMYRIKCYSELGMLDEAVALLTPSLVVPDMREGEYALARIWLEVYRHRIAADEDRPLAEINDEEVLDRYPIPYELDFRMN